MNDILFAGRTARLDERRKWMAIDLAKRQYHQHRGFYVFFEISLLRLFFIKYSMFELFYTLPYKSTQTKENANNVFKQNAIRFAIISYIYVILYGLKD